MSETGMMVDEKGELLYTITMSKEEFYSKFWCKDCPDCGIINDSDNIVCGHCQSLIPINPPQ